MNLVAGLAGPLFLAMQTAPAATPPEAEAACDMASVGHLRAAVDAGRLVQARRMLSMMAGNCSDSTEYLALEAETDLRDGRYHEAYSRFAALAFNNPEDPALASGAGRAALQAGHADEAFGWLTHATSLPCADWRAWNSLGVLLDRRRDWTGSARAYEQAVGLAPDEAAIWNNHGYSLVLQGRYQDALPLFDKAVALDTNDAAIRRTRDLAYALSGTFPDARRPGESTADWARRLNNMGYAAWIGGNVAAARSLLSRAIEISETRLEIAERNLALLEAGR